MAVNNSLTKSEAQAPVCEYEVNGEKVKLSTSIIRKYLVSGGGNATDEEVFRFLTLCRYQKLNPFLKEAYLVKYGSLDATIVTGKDYFQRRANKNPNYAGKTAGIIVCDKESGVITEREGTCYSKEREILLGGWARVYIKGHDRPEYQSVNFDEYVGRKKDGTVNAQWESKPATMIRKVAVVQALREAFTDDFEGLLAPEEVGDVGSAVLNDNSAPIEVNEHEETVIKEAVTRPAPAPESSDVASALFGE